MKTLLGLSMGMAPPPEHPDARATQVDPMLASSPPELQEGTAQDDVASAVNLVWDAPSDECSDPEAMQARLDEAMQLNLVDNAAGRERWVIARVRKTGERWTLRLWVAPEGGLSERALTENSCGELERATLTIVAMLMPPVMFVPNPEPPPEAADMKPPDVEDPLGDAQLEALIGNVPASKPPPDPGGPDMEAPEPSKLRGAIGFAGAVGRGTMPATAGGLAVTTALLFPGARLEVVGNFSGTQNIGVRPLMDVLVALGPPPDVLSLIHI
ncbi:MAG: hypothetical protein KUG77_03345 [Nannocystaceae bacterium]|nr:hypothetical protein [Nannocystaceae bacterium]